MDLTGGSLFDDLPAEAQRKFLSYEFSVDLLVDATDADVLDVFARINSYSLPLNEQEKRNAKFFGAFKQTVYDLGFVTPGRQLRQPCPAGLPRLVGPDLISGIIATYRVLAASVVP
jgi:hypothetical protein